jgi:protein O-GlcNAc transferase
MDKDPRIPVASLHPTNSAVDDYPSNALASTLGRDTILSYAYQLYQTQHNPGQTSILSVTPVFNPLPALMSSEHIYSQVASLLTTMRSLYPQYLPTLLLLGTIYYAMEDFSSSLRINEEILSIDAEYVSQNDGIHLEWLIAFVQVEAMCNIGAVMRKLGRPDEAYNWWWKALQLQPAYWAVTVPYSTRCRLGLMSLTVVLG